MLVVDDNKTNCVVLTCQLRAWDMTVDFAFDAAEGLDRLRRAVGEGRAYDLAIVDMVMPGMDGLEMACVVRADPALASVRMLLASSVTLEPDAVALAGLSTG